MSDSKHPRRLIAVIGDGYLDSEDDRDKIERAVALGESLVDAGYRVACGGMGGVMRAVCRGARASENYREGDTVGIVPTADRSDANEFVDIVLPTDLRHARNSVVAQCDALVALGGGAGTLSEMCFGWIYDRLIVAFRVDGWSGRLADRRVDDRIRFPDIEDDRIVGADSAEEAVEVLRERLPQYLAADSAG